MWLARRIGKSGAMMGAALWSGVMSFPLFFLGQGDGWAFVAVIGVRALSLTAWVILIPSMMADAADVDTLGAGRERTGVFFGALGFFTKAAFAVGIFVGATIPAMAGFQPSEPVHTEQGLARAAAGLRDRRPSARGRFRLRVLAFPDQPGTTGRTAERDRGPQRRARRRASRSQGLTPGGFAGPRRRNRRGLALSSPRPLSRKLIASTLLHPAAVCDGDSWATGASNESARSAAQLGTENGSDAGRGGHRGCA
jgi:hypothetical protein